MTVCPVCEHQQAAGDVCDNCGKALAKPRAANIAVERLPELEQTPLVSRNINVTVERMPELDVHRMKTGPDLPVEAVPELDRGRAAPVAAVPVETMPDVDTGRNPDDGQRTAVPEGAVPCRYCGNVQATGLLCEKCGMKLPRVRTAPAAETAKGPRRATDKEETLYTRCKKCGARAAAGRECGDCAQFVPFPED